MSRAKLIRLLEKESYLLEDHDHIDFDVNMRENEERIPDLLAIEEQLAKVNKKILKAMKKEKKRRTNK